jgi:hypothetical protein
METIGTFKPDNLHGDIKFPEVRDIRTIPAGTAVKRGSILGSDFKPIVTGGTPDSIAQEDLAADATTRIIVVSETGGFNTTDLSTGDTKTPIEWKQELRKLSIFVRHPAP